MHRKKHPSFMSGPRGGEKLDRVLFYLILIICSSYCCLILHTLTTPPWSFYGWHIVRKRRRNIADGFIVDEFTIYPFCVYVCVYGVRYGLCRRADVPYAGLAWLSKARGK